MKRLFMSKMDMFVSLSRSGCTKGNCAGRPLVTMWTNASEMFGKRGMVSR